MNGFTRDCRVEIRSKRDPYSYYGVEVLSVDLIPTEIGREFNNRMHGFNPEVSEDIRQTEMTRTASLELAKHIMSNLKWYEDRADGRYTMLFSYMIDKEKKDFLTKIRELQEKVEDFESLYIRAEASLNFERNKTLWTIIKERTKNYCQHIHQKYFTTYREVSLEEVI